MQVAPREGWYLGGWQGDADEPDVEVVNTCLDGQQQLLALGHVAVGQPQPCFFLFQHVLHLFFNRIKAGEEVGLAVRAGQTVLRVHRSPEPGVSTSGVCKFSFKQVGP